MNQSGSSVPSDDSVPAGATADATWEGLQPKLAARLPYVRWLHERHASEVGYLTAEVESRTAEMDKKSSEIVHLRNGLPVLTDFMWQPWYPSMFAAREEIAAEAEESGFPELYRTEEVLYWLHIPGWISEWAETARPTRILDIGAGYGTLAIFCAKLTGATVACLDIETHRIAESLRDANGLVVHLGSIETDSLDWAGTVDAVVMTEVLEHFNFHPVPTMEKIAAVLVPGGRLFLSTPDSVSWGRVEEGPASYQDLPPADPGAPFEDRHIYQFTEEEVRDVLAASGFEVLRLERAPGRWGLHLNIEAERVS